MNVHLDRLMRNASFLYLNEVLLTAGIILVNFKVIDYLGPVRFGIYSTVLAFTFFFKICTESSGVDDLLISDLAHRPHTGEEFDAYVTTGVLLRLLMGLGAFLTALAAAFFLRYDRATFGLIALLSLGMIFSFNKRKNPFILRYVLTERRLVPELVTFLLTCLVLGGKVLLVALSAPLWTFVLADLVLVLILSFAFMAVGIRRGHFTLHPRLFRPSLAKDLFLRSLPVSFSGLFVVIFMRLDQVMLSKMKGMEAVGVYSVAVLLVEGWNFVVLIASILLLPVFARHRGSTKMPALLSLCFRAATWGSLLIIAVYTHFGEDLLHLLWGEKYLASAPTLRVLSWSALFMWVGGLHGPLVIAHGLQRYTPIIVSVQAAANILLNLLLIPEYGPAGAAAATCLSFGIGFSVAWAFPALRFLLVPTWREMIPAGFFAALVLFRWPQVPWLKPILVPPLMATLGFWLISQTVREIKVFSPAPAGRTP